MASRGHIQRQFSELISTINAHGYKLEDIIPAELSNHFQDMVALKEARTYIEAVEAHESHLQRSNTDLLAQLQEKQAELDNIPEDLKALKVDLQQSQLRIDFHKGIADRESERAAQYQCKFEKAYRQQIDTAEDARKIQQLEHHLAEREASIFKLLQENSSIRDVCEARLDEASRLVYDKEDTIAALRNHVVQLETEAFQERETADELTETCYSLMDDVGQENSTAAEVINAKSVQLFRERQSNDQFHSALVSEMIPLKTFYNHVFNILEVYRTTLDSVLAPQHTVPCNLPPSTNTMLDSAIDQLESYKQLATDLRCQSRPHKDASPQDRILEQIDSMAKTAADVYMSLDAFKQNLSKAVAQVHTNTSSSVISDALSDLRLQATLTRGSNSSRSSVFPFTHIVKHFSTKSA